MRKKSKWIVMIFGLIIALIGLSSASRGTTTTEQVKADTYSNDVQVTQFLFSGGDSGPYLYGDTTPTDFKLRYSFSGITTTKNLRIMLYYPLDFNEGSVANHYVGKNWSMSDTNVEIIDGRRYGKSYIDVSATQELIIKEIPLDYALKPAVNGVTIGFPDNYQFKIMAQIVDGNNKPITERISKDFIWKYPNHGAKKAIVTYTDSGPASSPLTTLINDTAENTKVDVGKEKSPNANQTSKANARYLEYRFSLSEDYVWNNLNGAMTEVTIEDTLPAGAYFDPSMNPEWVQDGNIVRRTLSKKEIGEDLVSHSRYNYSLYLMYPDAKQGQIFNNTATITATTKKNPLIEEGVTYNPYASISGDNAYEKKWTVSKPIQANITKENDSGSIFRKTLQQANTKYYDSESYRETGSFSFNLTVYSPFVHVYQPGEFYLEDIPSDSRFEAYYMVSRERVKAEVTDGSSFSEAFEFIVTLTDGRELTFTSSQFGQASLNNYRGQIKKIAVKNNKELKVYPGGSITFASSIRAKDYTQPLITSTNASLNITNGGYYSATGASGEKFSYFADGTILEFSREQSAFVRSDTTVELGATREASLPSAKLSTLAGDQYKDFTLAYLLPSSEEYKMIGVDGAATIDRYAELLAQVQATIDDNTFLNEAFLKGTGGKVELIENYNGTGRRGLVISYRNVIALADGIERNPLRSSFTIKVKAKASSPSTSQLPLYFKATPVNFDANKYTVLLPTKDIYDINKNGDKQELVSTVSQNIIYHRPQVLQGIKEAKGDLDTEFVDSTSMSKTTLTGGIQYRLSVYNELDKTATNVSIVDVLPRVGDTKYIETATGDQLASRDTEVNVYLNSAVTSNRAGVIYSYSTKPVPKTKTAFETFVNTAGNWSTTMPANKKLVTAVKVSGFNLTKGESIQINFSVTNDQNFIGKKRAMNSFYLSTTDNKVESNVVTTEIQGPDTRNLPITKKWDDKNNAAGKRPNKITVNLLQNGEPYKSVDITGGSGDATWSYTFTDLPVDDENGREWQYTIEEVSNNDYASVSIVKDPNNLAYTITNKLKDTIKTDIKGKKIWLDGKNTLGKRPTSVEIQLKRNGVLFKKTTITGGSTVDFWSYEFTNLDVYDGTGKAYVYEVVETTVPGGYVAEKGTADNEYAITNTLVMEKTVTKKWLDDKNENKKRPESIKLVLIKSWTDSQGFGHTEKGAAVTLEGDLTADSWTYTYKDLPVYSPDGSKYSYSIDEEEVKFYDKVVSGDTITNTLVLTTDIKVTKAWSDVGLSASDRPKVIKVQLKRDGENYGSVVTLVAGGNKKSTKAYVPSKELSYTFYDLPIYDDAGNTYQYTVEEVEVPVGYRPSYIITYKDGTEVVTGIKITNFTPVNLYVLQKVLDPIPSLAVPEKAFMNLTEGESESTFGLTSKSIPVNTATETGAPLSDYTKYTFYPSSTAMKFTIEDLIPEYYEYVGAVVAASHFAQEDLISSNIAYGPGQTVPLYYDRKEQIETYYVVFYIRPRVSEGEDEPRPYSWDYKTNTFGE